MHRWDTLFMYIYLCTEKWQCKQAMWIAYRFSVFRACVVMLSCCHIVIKILWLCVRIDNVLLKKQLHISISIMTFYKILMTRWQWQNNDNGGWFRFIWRDGVLQHECCSSRHTHFIFILFRHRMPDVLQRYSATVRIRMPSFRWTYTIYLYIKYIDILMGFDRCKTNCSNCSAAADCFVVSQETSTTH